MVRRNPLLVVLVAIVVLVVLDELVARYWASMPSSGLVSEIIVIAVVAYLLVAIFARGRLRFPSFSFQRRRRMRVVKRDPTKAAADFIKQFEDRAQR